MTRQPDIKSKSDRAVYSPSSMEGKQKVRDLKALCIQDAVTANDLLDEALNLLFKVHHWPPGNPQLTLTNYQVKPSKVLSKCEFSGCKGEAIASGVFLPKNKEYRLCKRHLVEAKNSRKVWELKN
jgi:hypothetical protein